MCKNLEQPIIPSTFKTIKQLKLQNGETPPIKAANYHFSTSTPKNIAEARKTQYIGFLHRHPFATDAYELGYATGIREDYNLIEGEPPNNLDLPVTILDNDFQDPDIDRYLKTFNQYDPSVAILGDAYNPEQAHKFQNIADQLLEEHPYKEIVVVPKCKEAFDILDQDTVLGYPMGYSDLEPGEYSQLSDWRGRRLHLLGASPPKQYEVIEKLTQEWITREPPADIIGLDYNGIQKAAYFGEYWSREGYQRADHLTIRETVRKSLQEMKQYWIKRNIWPETEPREIYGDAVQKPDEFLFMDQGGDPIPSREELEDSYVETYEEYGTAAFKDESSKKFAEVREDLTPVDT